MNSEILTFIIIPVTILAVATIARLIRGRVAKPKMEAGAQKPGTFDGCLLKFITMLAAFSGMMTVVGFVTGVTEMGVVFLVITLIIAGCAAIMKYAYKIAYEENGEHFILKVRGNEHHVAYADIIDWQPGFNEIKVLDETGLNQKYIRVNIAMIKPEILLTEIARMTNEGKFSHPVNGDKDPDRTDEYKSFLQNNGYAHLAEHLDQT